jgi:hypothetical protein
MTAQVLKMQGKGEIEDLKKASDQIKAEAKERAKMLRWMMKAGDEGIDLDDEDDDQ